jgi:hypothetical protein
MGNARSAETFAPNEVPSRKVFIKYCENKKYLSESIGFSYHIFKYLIRYQRYYWSLIIRFDDIVKLDKYLFSHYRGKMETIKRPEKYSKLLTVHDEALLTKRGIDILIYLQFIVDDEELFQSPYVQNFLGIGKVRYYYVLYPMIHDDIILYLHICLNILYISICICIM